MLKKCIIFVKARIYCRFMLHSATIAVGVTLICTLKYRFVTSTTHARNYAK